MSTNIKHIDFEILKEFWNKYELNDNTYLKTRVILTDITKVPKENGFEYGFGFKDLKSILSSKESRGTPPSAQPTNEDIQKSEWSDVRYNTISEEWNEYLADDGARVRLKSTVTQIRKSSIYRLNGEPIYDIRISILPQFSPPKI